MYSMYFTCVVLFRILRQKQYEKEREREFVLALEREAVRPYMYMYNYVTGVGIGEQGCGRPPLIMLGGRAPPHFCSIVAVLTNHRL